MMTIRTAGWLLCSACLALAACGEKAAGAAKKADVPAFQGSTGASAYVAWGIIALIPFVGLIAYLVLRPHSYAADREEQELDMALRERQLAQYGTCPQCGAPIEKDFVVCPVCDTQVRNVCPSCHRPLDAHWKVCPYCRTRIQ